MDDVLKAQKAKTAKITKRKLPEPEFKKAPKITGLEYLSNYYKKLQMPKPVQHQDIVLSRRIDEGVSKDYRNDGIVAGNKAGRFLTYWTVPGSDVKYARWNQAKAAAGDKKIERIKDADNQISVLSSAIHSYDYYPDVKKLLLRYTSNPTKDYEFVNVTQRRKNDLDNAASKGRFVQYVLRKYNNKYKV